MTPWRRVWNLRVAGWIIFGVVGTLVVAIPAFPLLFPTGIQSRGPAIEEGLLTVGNGNWKFASFQPVELLAKNEASRSEGSLIGGTTCIEVSPVLRAELDRALGQAQMDQDGRRGVWVKFVATRRFGTNACIDRPNARGRRRIYYASYPSIVAIKAVRPLACTPFAFTLYKRRCPPPPPPPRTLNVEGYPEDAARRGAEGQVSIVAIVGPKNELIDCKVIQSSGDAALDQAACGVFRENAAAFAGKGSSDGLASGVRRIKTWISFELDQSEVKDPVHPRVKNRS
jgi:TonB family protein